MPIRPLIVKEVKELLRDPRIVLSIILVPLVMFPLMGGIVGYAQKASMPKTETIGVMDLDNTQLSHAFISFLMQSNFTVITVEPGNPSEALAYVEARGGRALLVVEEGFSRGLRNGSALLSIYMHWQGGLMTTVGLIGRISSAAQAFKDLYVAQILEQSGNDPGVLRPIGVRGSIITRRGTLLATEDVFTALMQSYSLLPVIGIVMISVVMQVVATSIASEKENKTLESLLTLPVERWKILMAKIIGPTLLALLSSVIYVFGMNYYFSKALPSAGVEVSIKDIVGLGNLVVYGLVIASAVFAMSTIALIIASFAEDVRGATSMVSFFYVFVFLPAFLIMLTGSKIPYGYYVAMHAIPSTSLFTAMDNLMAGNSVFVFYCLLYNFAFSALMVFVGSRVFGSEKIFTARLFRKLRSR